MTAPDAPPQLGVSDASAPSIDAYQDAPVPGPDRRALGGTLVFARSQGEGASIQSWVLGSDQVNSVTMTSADDLLVAPDGGHLAAFRTGKELLTMRDASFSIHELPGGAVRATFMGRFFGWRSSERILFFRLLAPWRFDLIDARLDGSDEQRLFSTSELDVVRFTRWSHSADRLKWVFTHGYYRGYGPPHTLRVIDVADPMRAQSTEVPSQQQAIITEDDRVVWLSDDRGRLTTVALDLANPRSVTLLAGGDHLITNLAPWGGGRLVFLATAATVGHWFTVATDGTGVTSHPGLDQIESGQPIRLLRVDRTGQLVFAQPRQGAAWVLDLAGTPLLEAPAQVTAAQLDWR